MKVGQTVVELPEYIKQANALMGLKERDEFVSFIAKNPHAGDLISGTGGARKVRWANIDSKGKSGGSRIIYFHHNDDVPIFLLTAYGKNQKANLTQKEKNTLKLILKQLVDIYQRGENDE